MKAKSLELSPGRVRVVGHLERQLGELIRLTNKDPVIDGALNSTSGVYLASFSTTIVPVIMGWILQKYG